MTSLTVHTLSTVHPTVHRELLSTLFLSVDPAMAGWEGAEMAEYNRARREARWVACGSTVRCKDLGQGWDVTTTRTNHFFID